MPMSSNYTDRISPVIGDIAEHFDTPFHIYDERGIRQTGSELIKAFKNITGFREYFAVKALPNPAILKIMYNMGFGFDCSSIPELVLARQAGATNEDIMFTSNNTSPEDFQASQEDGGCILNLDDITLIDKTPLMPELICFRYNPGPLRTGNDIIGNPVESKYGVSHDQITEAYRRAINAGAKRFGMHTMLASNELNYKYMVETARMILDTVKMVSDELKINFEFVNIGGGLGIPYKPEDPTLDIVSMGAEISTLFDQFKTENGYTPKLYLESGRYMTGPHGTLVTRAINRKDIYRSYIGVDACMTSLMRPGIYGAYHHITVSGKENAPLNTVVDVVGSLCENNDKFAIQRSLPSIEEGDLLMIHDTGAHGHAMGFNYNAKMRPKELLLKEDGSVQLIRREETIEDYFATLNFEQNIFSPSGFENK
jgi:diaminopimelate decarboxylase